MQRELDAVITTCKTAAKDSTPLYEANAKRYVIAFFPAGNIRAAPARFAIAELAKLHTSGVDGDKVGRMVPGSAVGYHCQLCGTTMGEKSKDPLKGIRKHFQGWQHITRSSAHGAAHSGTQVRRRALHPVPRRMSSFDTIVCNSHCDIKHVPDTMKV
jgi:hypothetical protein